MNKKLLKTIGALTGVGAIAAGSTLSLTSCGKESNHPDGLTDFNVEYRSKKLVISVADVSTNISAKALTTFYINNKVADAYLTVAAVKKVLLAPDATISSTLFTIAASAAETPDTGKGQKTVISIGTEKLKEADIGMYSLILTSPGFVTWTLQFSVTK